MVDIRHRVGIKADPAQIFQALTTQAGLAGWWTRETTVQGAGKGGAIQFRFGGDRGADVAVEDAQPGRRVQWKVTAGPDEWLGTTIQFDLQPGEEDVGVLFRHGNWKAPSDFMAHCSMKWGVFLMSLKSLVEQGLGQPFPNDPKITATN